MKPSSKLRLSLKPRLTKDLLIIKYSRLSHDVVTCDVDRDVSTAYC